MDEEDVENGETVLLFPRLVLERIRLTPTRSSNTGTGSRTGSSTASRRQSEEATNSSPSPAQGAPSTPPQAPDTPRTRESFEG